MTVQAVDAGVELAADEPLDRRRVEVVLRDGLPLLEPGDPLGLLAPERVRVRHRAVVERAVLLHAADVRLLRELVRDPDDALALFSHAGASCSQGERYSSDLREKGPDGRRNRVLNEQRMSLRIEVMRISPARGEPLPLPSHATDGAAGLDLRADAAVSLAPGERALVPTGLVVAIPPGFEGRSEEHTSELQSRLHLVCRLLLEKKKKKTIR